MRTRFIVGFESSYAYGPKSVGLKSYILSPGTGTDPVTRNVVIFVLYCVLYFYYVQ